jgi:hypothetical protein
MRKMFMILTLAASYLAVAAHAWPPPECDPNCPWVQVR